MAESTKTLLFVQIFSYVLLLSHPQQESSFVKLPTMPYLSHKSLPPQWDKERGFQKGENSRGNLVVSTF